MNFKVGNFTWGAGLIFFIVLFSSCASLRKSNTLFQSEFDKFADTAKTVYVVNEQLISDSAYHIKPFDFISVRNVQNPEGITASTSQTPTDAIPLFRLDSDAAIVLPAIGKINLLGLTEKEATDKIQKIYAEKLLKDPLIVVSVVNRKVTVLGEVTKPGIYILEPEKMNLIDLLGKSGNILSSANPRMIKIIRGDLKNPEIIYLNLTDVRTLASSKIVLRTNDIIYVPSKGIFRTNENLRNYSGVLQPLILVLNAVVLLYSISR